MRQIFTIARYSALEAVRGRTLIWSAATLLVLYGTSVFLQEIAIADGARLQTAFLAASARLACVFIAATVIISAVVREFNEQTHLLLLSLPLARLRHLIGRFLGFAALLVLLAGAAGLLLGLSAPAHAPAWAVALLLELLITGSMALFAAFGVRQMLPALLVTLGFYVLARTIGTLQLLAHAGETPAWLVLAVDVVAWLLPRLDAFASSTRALGEQGGLLILLVQAVLYCALLLTATALEVSRRDL